MQEWDHEKLTWIDHTSPIPWIVHGPQQIYVGDCPCLSLYDLPSLWNADSLIRWDLLSSDWHHAMRCTLNCKFGEFAHSTLCDQQLCLFDSVFHAISFSFPRKRTIIWTSMLPHTTTFGNPDYRCPRKIAAKPTLTLYVKYVGKQALNSQPCFCNSCSQIVACKKCDKRWQQMKNNRCSMCRNPMTAQRGQPLISDGAVACVSSDNKPYL